MQFVCSYKFLFSRKLASFMRPSFHLEIGWQVVKLKKCFFFIMVLIASSEYIFAGNFILFLGNPGTGKSSIINSLLQEEVVKSGLSAGGGLTKQFQRVSKNGLDFIDTPGLSDSTMEEEAALEIEKALNLNGHYAIFFVISAKDGRIDMADCKSINRIMKSINVKDKPFHILINRISRRVRTEIFDNQQNYNLFLERLRDGLEVHCSSVQLIDYDEELDNQEKAFLSLEPRLIQFILRDATKVFIPSQSTRRIETDTSIKKQARENQQALLDLQRQQERQKKEEYARRVEHCMEVCKIRVCPSEFY